MDAEAYDRYIGQWSRMFVAPLLDAAAVGPDDLVLDLATGTGEAAIAAAQGRARGVVGADVAIEAVGIPAGEDHLGPLSACSPGRFEPDSGAAADHNDGLPEEFRLALTAKDGGCGAHDSFDQLSKLLFRELSAGLLRHHVRGVPVGPVLVALPDAFLVLAVGGRRTFERAHQVACGAE